MKAWKNTPTSVAPGLLTVRQAGRNKFVFLLIINAVVASTTAFSVHAVAQTASYTISEIQGAVVPCRLNNVGDIAGRVLDHATGEGRAATWHHGNLRRTVLGKLAGGDYSSASAVNDAGQVVGNGNTSNSVVPFLWTPGNGFRRIPLLPGDNCGQTVAINRYGHLSGYSSGANGKRAFLWKRGNQIRSLEILPGGGYSSASDVNDSDDVVGTGQCYGPILEGSST